MARTVRSLQGDTLDRLCYRHLGTTTDVSDVYALNPGLCDDGPILPAGTAVHLPTRGAATATPVITTINLWD
ncbi:tail protein X [Larsenimonas rhizosphaerae]|uniref:tail protein X n=1 Tax=Larsenimonas rhizosphaerae TaxID=2944682 RepID=UPI002033720E|nr:tail protein X [Larsenimonas rhizosphaerae]MCM2131473.1 tail protein X [Larsenimonas rhizosphaerae]